MRRNGSHVSYRLAICPRVDAETGLISTVAGTGQAGFSGDAGPATSAQLHQPHSIELDARGNLYIADILNHRIRRVDLATGAIDTFAGTGVQESTPVDAAGGQNPTATRSSVPPRGLRVTATSREHDVLIVR